MRNAQRLRNLVNWQYYKNNWQIEELLAYIRSAKKNASERVDDLFDSCNIWIGVRRTV